jgi:hypothetical protein
MQQDFARSSVELDVLWATIATLQRPIHRGTRLNERTQPQFLIWLVVFFSTSPITLPPLHDNLLIVYRAPTTSFDDYRSFPRDGN